MQRVFAFIDGSYIRASAADACGSQCIDIRRLALEITARRGVHDARLVRTCYYDAEPQEHLEPADPVLARYWKEMERLDDVELRFGYLKAKSRKTPRQQKGVDVLLAVDLVVGAFTGIFDAAILVSGDADFVPAVQEARRRGVVIVLASFKGTTSEELVDACDRVFYLDDEVKRFRHGMT